jgi:hypothetical protein
MIEPCDEKPKPATHNYCRVCLVEHDDDIHSATLDVHAWYRARVTRFFDKDEPAEEAVA